MQSAFPDGGPDPACQKRFEDDKKMAVKFLTRHYRREKGSQSRQDEFEVDSIQLSGVERAIEQKLKSKEAEREANQEEIGEYLLLSASKYCIVKVQSTGKPEPLAHGRFRTAGGTPRPVCTAEWGRDQHPCLREYFTRGAVSTGGIARGSKGVQIANAWTTP